MRRMVRRAPPIKPMQTQLLAIMLNQYTHHVRAHTISTHLGQMCKLHPNTLHTHTQTHCSIFCGAMLTTCGVIVLRPHNNVLVYIVYTQLIAKLVNAFRASRSFQCVVLMLKQRTHKKKIKYGSHLAPAPTIKQRRARTLCVWRRSAPRSATSCALGKHFFNAPKFTNSYIPPECRTDAFTHPHIYADRYLKLIKYKNIYVNTHAHTSFIYLLILNGF